MSPQLDFLTVYLVPGQPAISWLPSLSSPPTRSSQSSILTSWVPTILSKRLFHIFWSPPPSAERMGRHVSPAPPNSRHQSITNLPPNADFLRPAPAGGTGGRIVFVSATIHYTGLPLQTHVAVAKAGVDALSNAIAIELGPRGMTSNVIAPGPIGSTEGMERLARSSDVEAVASRVPSGRFGTVKEIADATIYLFSDSGNYVNGDALVGKFEPAAASRSAPRTKQ